MPAWVGRVKNAVWKFIRSPATFLEWTKEYARDLPSTNWMYVLFGGLAVLSGVVYLAVQVAFVFVIKPETQIEYQHVFEPVAWGLWLGFIAGGLGFSVRQFRHKRETYMGDDGKGESIRHAEARNGGTK